MFMMKSIMSPLYDTYDPSRQMQHDNQGQALKISIEKQMGNINVKISYNIL